LKSNKDGGKSSRREILMQSFQTGSIFSPPNFWLQERMRIEITLGEPEEDCVPPREAKTFCTQLQIQFSASVAL
jgi:hypothetical protein